MKDFTEELLYLNAEKRASALPVEPGSVELHLACSCGRTFDGPVHTRVLERFAAIFRRAHSGPGHEVSRA